MSQGESATLSVVPYVALARYYDAVLRDGFFTCMGD
jgi:hypothetical protein